MSSYELERLIYDQLRRWSHDRADEIDPSAYELSPDEAAAFAGREVGRLFALGVHPVLLNSLCRGLGITRDDYREMLQPYRTVETRVPRWRVSS